MIFTVDEAVTFGVNQQGLNRLIVDNIVFVGPDKMSGELDSLEINM